MCRRSVWLMPLVLMAGLVSCKSVQNVSGVTGWTGDTSRNALDWAGTYSGVLPCASCPGIETVKHLNSDHTYRLETTYQDEGPDVFSETGRFEWNEQGNRIALMGVDGSAAPNKYAVGENHIRQLDTEGSVITGALADKYVLLKVSDLEEKYWKLVEFDGDTLVYDAHWHREPHLVFRSFDQRVRGSSGCNSFFGSYALKEGSQVVFSTLGATKMACGGNSIEKALFELLDGLLDYEVVHDQFDFSRAGKQLARFELVWLY